MTGYTAAEIAEMEPSESAAAVTLNATDWGALLDQIEAALRSGAEFPRELPTGHGDAVAHLGTVWKLCMSQAVDYRIDGFGGVEVPAGDCAVVVEFTVDDGMIRVSVGDSEKHLHVRELPWLTLARMAEQLWEQIFYVPYDGELAPELAR